MPNYDMTGPIGRGQGCGMGLRRGNCPTDSDRCPRFPNLPRFWRQHVTADEEIKILESRLAELKK